jgi:hypothetical protein
MASPAFTLSTSDDTMGLGEGSSSTVDDKTVNDDNTEALYRTILGIHSDTKGVGLCDSDALWEAQAFCLRSRGDMNQFMEKHFGEEAQKAARRSMEKNLDIGVEKMDNVCDSFLVKFGQAVHVGLNQCNDQLDVTLAYLCNDKVSTKVVSTGPMNKSFTDLTDTDATKTTLGGRHTAVFLADTTETDSGRPLRHLANAAPISRSRSANTYLIPLDKKKVKRKMFSNLMSAANPPTSKEGKEVKEKSKKRSSLGVRSSSSGGTNVKHHVASPSGDSDDFLDFKQSISKTLSAELADAPSSPRHVSETGNLERRQSAPSKTNSKTHPRSIYHPRLSRTSNPLVVDLAKEEIEKSTLDQYKQSYRKYAIRDQGGVTHIDLLEEHVDLIDNHIDLVELLDPEEQGGLIDLTNYGLDRTTTW